MVTDKYLFSYLKPWSHRAGSTLLVAFRFKLTERCQTIQFALAPIKRHIAPENWFQSFALEPGKIKPENFT
jgi:hypothetical protein